MFCLKVHSGVLSSSDQMGKEHNAGGTSRLSTLMVVVRQPQAISLVSYLEIFKYSTIRRHYSLSSWSLFVVVVFFKSEILLYSNDFTYRIIEEYIVPE